MGVIVCRAFLVLLLAPALAATQSTVVTNPMIAPQPVTIAGATAFVYKTVRDVQLRLHVFTPDGAAKTPQAKHFAQRGVVALVADYRVFSRHGTAPFDAMSDAKSAVRWTRAHALELGVDPSRIVAAGGSAGGHIALSSAIFDAFDDPREDLKVSSRPDALLLLNPEVDTVDTPSHPTFELLRARFGDRGMEASPVHHLRAGLPPTLILHGKADTEVVYADVERFCAQSRLRGNQCQLVGYEGAEHSFFNFDRAGGKWYRETLREADRFLTSIGYLGVSR